MSDDQYNKLFQYMHGQFTAINDQVAEIKSELAKKADAARLDGLRVELTQVERRLMARADEHEETITDQLDEIQNAIGETFIEEKKRVDRHQQRIDQLAKATGAQLKPEV